MIKCFFKSIFTWAKSGFKLVNYFEYWRRRQICKNCSGNGPRCPICGCFLWGYCRLSTSNCKHWQTIKDPSFDLVDFKIRPTKDN